MPGARPVRTRAGALTGHRILKADPFNSGRLVEALENYIRSKTQESYDSAASSFQRFCADRGLHDFPVDPIVLATWIVYEAVFIKISSLKGYLSGVRSAQIDRGYNWVLQGNPTCARALRFVKRKYGSPEKAMKIPISLGTLLRMCELIPGWPIPELVSHDDRLFIAASCIGTMGFLRGGEFLTSSKSSRPLLLFKQVQIKRVADRPTVVVSIAHPKAKWWLTSQDVLCVAPSSDALLNPVAWLSAYRILSPVPFHDDRAAFLLEDGSPLSRNWMVKKTEDLLRAAKIDLQDARGAPVKVLASSWRAGGVQSAKEANLSDATIMSLGRWKSNAWTNYSFDSISSLQAAGRSMWEAALIHKDHTRLRVGSFNPAGLFEEESGVEAESRGAF